MWWLPHSAVSLCNVHVFCCSCYQTADTSVSVKGEPTPNVSGHTRNTSGGHALNLSMGRGSKDGEENVSFEDRRKENFEAGRLELERRRKAIKEKQERDTVRQTLRC